MDIAALQAGGHSVLAHKYNDLAECPVCAPGRDLMFRVLDLYTHHPKCDPGCKQAGREPFCHPDCKVAERRKGEAASAPPRPQQIPPDIAAVLAIRPGESDADRLRRLRECADRTLLEAEEHTEKPLPDADVVGRVSFALGRVAGERDAIRWGLLGGLIIGFCAGLLF